MINLENLTPSNESVSVIPSDNIFIELGRNTYDYKDLLSELIDNSIAGRRPNIDLVVTIDIYIAHNYKPVEFVIKDNAKGIAKEILGKAISPAGLQSQNSLNEHGMGMKQAVAGLGGLNYLATKTENESKARVIRAFKFGEIETFETDFDSDSGTEISIKHLNSCVSAQAQTYTKTIARYLGARYRRFLRDDDKKIDLSISIRKADDRDNFLHTWKIEQEKPIYFHPSTRKNEPVILSYDIEDDGWKASLTFGYAPSKKEEYEELGLNEPNKYHPYKVTFGSQGLDIIFQDRVILFHQLSQIGIISSPHPDFNNIRGEIDLKYGFSTAITKNSIIKDANFEKCIEKIKMILNGQETGPSKKPTNYITQKTYPEAIPEKLLRDRLIKYLKTNPLNPKHNVKKEYSIEGIDGHVDILADGEAWELKTETASALDVYQLFMYMDIGNLSKGYLLAKNFTPGTQIAIEHIKEKHGKEIILATRDQFPINQPPTEEERENYY
jgi:Histidine kinase-, DNA gyrase B-, and HSP90-like ATPase